MGRSSLIWLFVNEIYTVKDGEPIPSNLWPLKQFVVAPDGVVPPLNPIFDHLGKEFVSKKCTNFRKLEKKTPNVAPRMFYSLSLGFPHF